MSSSERASRRLHVPGGVTGFLVTSLGVACVAALFVWMTVPASTGVPVVREAVVFEPSRPSRRRRWLPVAGRAVSWLVTGLAAALLIAFIAWMTLPRILSVQALIVLTGSMEPALPVGSVAFVEKSGASDVKAGDVITFYRPDQRQRSLITHRVIEVIDEKGSPAYRTQGDANDVADDWVVPSNLVMGEVKTVVPYVGYLTEHVRGRNAFVALMVIPGAIIIWGEIGKIRRELKLMRAPV